MFLKLDIHLASKHSMPSKARWFLTSNASLGLKTSYTVIAWITSPLTVYDPTDYISTSNSKEFLNGQRDQKFWPKRRIKLACFAHFWWVPQRCHGCLLALEVQYKPPTGICHKPCEVTTKPQSRAPHVLCAGCIIHSLKHTIELVKYSRKHVH